MVAAGRPHPGHWSNRRFRNGNGRCARHLVHVLSRHDLRLACTRLIGLLGLHRARGRLFVPCVKAAARAGDFEPMPHVYSQQMETGIREWTPLFDGMSGSIQDDAQSQVVVNAVCQRARFLLEQGGSHGSCSHHPRSAG